MLLSIIPAGNKPFSGDPPTQNRTGAYKLNSFTSVNGAVRIIARVRITLVTFIDFNESTAQVNALLGADLMRWPTFRRPCLPSDLPQRRRNISKANAAQGSGEDPSRPTFIRPTVRPVRCLLPPCSPSS